MSANKGFRNFGWLCIIAIAIFVIIHYNFKMDDVISLTAFCIAAARAWNSQAMDNEQTGSTILGLVLTAMFWVLLHEIDDLRYCVDSHTPAEQCHAIIEKYFESQDRGDGN